MCVFTAEEWSIIALSLKTSLASLLLIAIPGTAISWLLAKKKFFGKSIIEALCYLPLVLPPVVVGYLLLILFSPRTSPFGSFLQSMGIEVVFTWRAVSIACAIVSFPLFVRTVKAFMESVDPRLEKSARLLGAGPWRTFFTITLPLSVRGLIAGGILALARSLGEFGATAMFAGIVPEKTITVPVAIFRDIMLLNDQEGSAFRLALASVAISLAAIFVSELIVRKTDRRATT